MISNFTLDIKGNIPKGPVVKEAPKEVKIEENKKKKS